MSEKLEQLSEKAQDLEMDIRRLEENLEEIENDEGYPILSIVEPYDKSLEKIKLAIYEDMKVRGEIKS